MSTSVVSMLDGFCGGGGASWGAASVGVEIAVALNHNPRSLATHMRNFPQTLHAQVDITQEDPRNYPTTTMAWFSPECTYHSTSRGTKLAGQHQPELPFWTDKHEVPFAEKSRASMREVLRWAEVRCDQGHPFELIFVENVTKVVLWSGYYEWLSDMRKLGYEHRVLSINSMFVPGFPSPVPQSRDRWYCCFWRRGNKAPDLDLRPAAYCEACAEEMMAVQSWRNGKRVGDYGRQYDYRCPRCARIVQPTCAPSASIIDWSLPIQRIGDRKRPLKDTTIERVAEGIKRFQPTPFLLETTRTFSGGGYVRSVLSSSFTQSSAQSLALAVPDVAKNAFLMSYYGAAAGYRSVYAPSGTCTSRDRHALIVPEGNPGSEAVADCGFRMLTARENARLMGFPDTYEFVATSEREKTRQAGLAVTPNVAAWLVQRGLESLGYGTTEKESGWHNATIKRAVNIQRSYGVSARQPLHAVSSHGVRAGHWL